MVETLLHPIPEPRYPLSFRVSGELFKSPSHNNRNSAMDQLLPKHKLGVLYTSFYKGRETSFHPRRQQLQDLL